MVNILQDQASTLYETNIRIEVKESYLDSIIVNHSDKYSVIYKSDLDTIMKRYFIGQNIGGK
jgi:hypothetical protein